MRTHTVKQVVHFCKHHNRLKKASLWNNVLNENLCKNGAVNALQSYLKIDSDDPELAWRFEGSGGRRVLHVSLPLDSAGELQKAGAQLMLDDMVGLGLVVVE